jgi:hypothetical protein
MNINEIKQLIAAADVCGHVPLISGLHGLGKSESAAQYAKEQNMHFEPLILSLMDTGDMLGLPETRDINGMSSTLWAAPSWYTNIVNAAWPEELKLDRLQFTDNAFHEHVVASTSSSMIPRGDLNSMYCDFYDLPKDRLQLLTQSKVNYVDSRRSVLFLDEFNRAPQDILNASLQLILDHRLHSHILPVVRGQETLVIAAINPTGADYTVQEFDPALLDRFVVCDVEPDFKSWLKWAKNNNVNQIVIDFLIDNQKKFHLVPEDGTKGATPRSWTRLAHYLDRLEDTPKEIMTNYIVGTVGSSLAAQFMMFYNNYSNALSSKDVEKLIKKEIAAAKRKGNVNPEEISETISEIISNLDAVQRGEFAETFVKKYIDNDNVNDAMPLLVFMYALPLESLSAILKTIQTDNIDHYTQLAILDKEANEKGLFKKLVANLKGI